MSNKSLYLLQSNFSATPAVVAKLEKMYSPEDSVILMGEHASPPAAAYGHRNE